ncbi:YqjK family protein [Aquabacterium sp. CECT 9606]|uniref:YqjK family protein n=1 Tax=Aquabacterium sp. CECT 9606 TaxID=2845822 RepID=UPI001EF9BC48|nr:hypothetical protein AQB9606_03759 [Aquabacterium sp. CECT 9606]
MTARRSQELVLKKQLLQQRSAVLRHSLARQSATTLAPVLGVVDRVYRGGRWLAAHPVLVVGVAAWLFRRRPKRLLTWGSRVWWLWRTWRQLQPLLAGKANT